MPREGQACDCLRCREGGGLAAAPLTIVWDTKPCGEVVGIRHCCRQPDDAHALGGLGGDVPETSGAMSVKVSEARWRARGSNGLSRYKEGGRPRRDQIIVV